MLAKIIATTLLLTADHGFAGVSKKLPGQFSLKPLNGKTALTQASLSHDGYTLVQFWASWCTTCGSTMKQLATWSAKQSDFGLVTVSVDESMDEAKTYFEGKNKDLAPFMSKAYLDEGGSFAEMVQIEGIPTVLMVNRSGNIIYKIYGHPSVADLNKMRAIANKTYAEKLDAKS